MELFSSSTEEACELERGRLEILLLEGVRLSLEDEEGLEFEVEEDVVLPAGAGLVDDMGQRAGVLQEEGRERQKGWLSRLALDAFP